MEYDKKLFDLAVRLILFSFHSPNAEKGELNDLEQAKELLSEEFDDIMRGN